ncbi:MAG: ribonuclease P protein component [Alphaproteobacteria bacterium]|nr:ribonuclease P protein component [Alphaproteobacteria bacterium]
MKHKASIEDFKKDFKRKSCIAPGVHWYQNTHIEKKCIIIVPKSCVKTSVVRNAIKRQLRHICIRVQKKGIKENAFLFYYYGTKRLTQDEQRSIEIGILTT